MDEASNEQREGRNQESGSSVPLNKNYVAFISLYTDRNSQWHSHHTRRWPYLEIIKWPPRFGLVVGCANRQGTQLTDRSF
jgi:hypothetical protein